MWWALPVATTLMGMNNARRKAEQQERYNKGQAEVTRYSPWTGMTGKLDNSYTPSMLEGGLQGGMAGLGAMQGMKGAFGAQPAQPQLGGMDELNQELGMMPASQPTMFGRGPSYTA